MNKFIFAITLVAITMFSISSCNTYTSLSNATKVSELSGNPYVQNVAKSVIKNIGQSLMQNGLKEAPKFNLTTDLSSILSTAQAVSGFKNMLTNTYGIASNTVDQKYSKWVKVKDVIAFVAKNATKGVNFYMN